MHALIAFALALLSAQQRNAAADRITNNEGLNHAK